MVVLHVNHVVDRTHLPLAVYYLDRLTYSRRGYTYYVNQSVVF
jgi:hypothetical protein